MTLLERMREVNDRAATWALDQRDEQAAARDQQSARAHPLSCGCHECERDEAAA